MQHLFYFSTGQGPSTHPSAFIPEERGISTPRPCRGWENTFNPLTNRIVSSQRQSQRLRSHFKGGCCRYRALPLAAVSVLYIFSRKEQELGPQHSYLSKPFSGNSLLNASCELVRTTQ